MDASSPALSFPGSARRWFLVGLVAILLIVSIRYTMKAMSHRSAIVRWQSALVEFEAGADIYRRYAHPNSPMLVTLLSWLTMWPPLVGALAWFYFKLALTVVAVFWIFRLVEEPGLAFPPWARALTVLLSLRPIVGDLTHGNVNLFILFLVMAALTAFRHRWDLSAGFLLALAIACKVTPALFVPYFLWKRAWKTLAGCLAGLVLFAWFIPCCVLGFDDGSRLLYSWTEQMILPFVVSGEVYYSEHHNQSLAGLALRLLTESPSFSTWTTENVRVPLHFHNFLDLPPRAAGWIVKGCLAVFVGLVLWSCRTPLAQRQGWRLPAEFSLVLLGMLLFSERTWKHHCVTLLLPCAVLMYYLAACRPAPRVRGYLIGTLIAATLLMLTTSTGPDGDQIATPAFGKLAQVYGAFVWAYICLMAALVVILRVPDRAALDRDDAAAEAAWRIPSWQHSRS